MTQYVFNTLDEIQVVLGERLRQLRLQKNFSQQVTAEKAGISEKAMRNLEAGKGSTVETLLRVLKALDQLQGLDLLVPEVGVDPIALLRKSKRPRRVRRSRQAAV